MKKESNFLFSAALLGGALCASSISVSVLLGTLGAVKILNHFARGLPIPFRQIVSWPHSMIFEVFAIAVTFLMRPFGYGSNKKAFCSLSAGRPVLLVHGYLHDSSAWIFLKRALCRRGLGPLYTLNFQHPFRSIREYAEMVVQKAEEIERETKRTDLALIGHSMGGLVGAWYATKLAVPGKVTDVITIGSPLAGTRVAALAIGPNGREMERGSDFVRQLQTELLQNDTIRFYHIASRADQMILPYSSALTGLHPEREYLVDDIGHMTLLLSLRVANKIKEWL